MTRWTRPCALLVDELLETPATAADPAGFSGDDSCNQLSGSHKGLAVPVRVLASYHAVGFVLGHLALMPLLAAALLHAVLRVHARGVTP